MGKGGKPKIEVTEYYLSQHFGICTAEIDTLLDVLVKEKSILDTPQTTLGSVSISKLELFGGVKKEGGVEGVMHYLPGADDQFLPDALAQRLGRANGADCPGYRGLSSLFFVGTSLSRGFYWTANSPFVPGVWAKVKRIFKRSDGSAQWYDEKAEIGSCAGGGGATAYGFDTPYPTPIPTGPRSGGGNGLFFVLRIPQIRLELVSDTPFIWFTSVGMAVEYDRGTDSAFSAAGHPITTDGDGNVVCTMTEVFSTAEGDVTVISQATFLTDRVRYRVTADRLCNVRDTAPNTSAGFRTDFVWGAAPPLASGYAGISTDADGDVLSTSLGDIVDTPTQQAVKVQITGARTLGLQIGPASIPGTGDMNPAHIIHECLTDREWGMGTPVSALDDVAFRAAADTLCGENFGLSMIWTRQAEIQKFINEVLDHIQAVLFTDPRTGLLVLKLIRGDYDAGTLPVIDPDTADLRNFSRKLWGDIVNEIVVTWTNPDNEQDETITVQDNASIAVQGGIVSDSRNYYGVRNASLAQDLAFRDLRSAGQPLASCDASVDRSQYDLTPGSVVKLTWPEYGLTELVMRVQSVDYGRPGDPEIKLQMVEDVYGLDIGSYDTPPATSWVDPAQAPSAMDPVQILTLPYFMAANSDVANFIESPEYPEVIAGLLASTSNSDAWEYDLLDDVTLASGDAQAEVITTNNVIGRGELDAPLVREAETTLVSFGTIIGNTAPTLGGFAIIGDGTEATDEIAMVTLDNGDGTYTLARGVLDTVPRDWPTGTGVFFVDENTVFEDPLIRSSGEVVDYKLLMRTSQGTFDRTSAALESHTLTDRPWQPSRPADVQIDGETFSTEGLPLDQADAYVDFPITWANRNRITEDSQVLRWDDAGVTAELGQTTTIEVRTLGGTLITAHTGLTGSAFDLPVASFGTSEVGEVRIFAERSDDDGNFVSLQYWSEWVRVAGEARITEADFERITEADEIRLLED